jgi:endonuclease YncB( thermonuclease family)
MLLAFMVALVVLFATAPRAQAAEVLQVRGADLLQVGDQNRSYPVQLGCVAVDAAHSLAATAWLRQALPRRTRVNLRPLGSTDGVLLARVSILSTGEDLGSGLVREGLATGLDQSSAPVGCPPVAATSPPWA